MYVCMYVRFRVKTGQTYIHSPFPRRRARKTQHTFQNGRKKVGMAPCRYVWMGRFPRPAWAKLTNIHTYATSKNSFFMFVLRFRLKTWPWPWNLKFRVFEKTVDFPCWLYNSVACVGKHTWNSFFEVVRKPT